MEDTNRSILQFCGDTDRQVSEICTNLEAVKKDTLALNQQGKDSATACQARGEIQEDRQGQLEGRLMELERENKTLLQQLENLKARQTLDQGSFQLEERLTELERENKILLQQLENLKAR